MTIAPVDEPLRDSAPLALRLAPTLCRKDPVTGASCAWNHGPWQFLRLFGLALGPANNPEFYLGALRRAAEASARPRVLVSGAADYSMLAYVVAAARSRDRAPDVTVVDLCETPLMLNRWYAERIGLAIRTSACNVLELADEQPFDIICTDNFLGRFDEAGRSRLLRKWRELLRPGGAAITVSRVSTSPEARLSFSAQEAEAFRAVAGSGARALSASVQFDAEMLDHQVREYTERPGALPPSAPQELERLFTEAGFLVQQVSWGNVERGIRDDVTGPRVPRVADYARIVAVRR
jgi:hypothetical protein